MVQYVTGTIIGTDDYDLVSDLTTARIRLHHTGRR
jgi:hypothetical protein